MIYSRSDFCDLALDSERADSISRRDFLEVVVSVLRVDLRETTSASALRALSNTYD